MSMWNAHSDRDYYDEAHGPYGTLDYVCPLCGDEFAKGVDDTGDLCDPCCSLRDALRQDPAIDVVRRHVKRGAA
jgi:hypothetical protein